MIRGKNGQPWIALSIWNYGEISLWAEVGKEIWKQFHVLPQPWMFWIHICGDVDTITGNITISIDGLASITRNFNKLGEEKPINLDQKLEIGITETTDGYGGKRSFRGKVSNVHFYVFDGSTSTEALSEKPCETKGSYLAWLDMEFKSYGDNVFELNERDDEVCAVQPTFYNLVLPGKMNWIKANHLCKVIGQGEMTGIKNEKELEMLASKTNNDIKSICPLIWLPLSDERKEGVWENTNTNLEPTFLKWESGQPNGLELQNYAVLLWEILSFHDDSVEKERCTICTSKTQALLTLRGTCKTSFLGILQLY